MKFRIILLAITFLASQSIMISAMDREPWLRLGITRAQWERREQARRKAWQAKKRQTGQRMAARRRVAQQRFRNLTTEQKRRLMARRRAMQARVQARRRAGKAPAKVAPAAQRRSTGQVTKKQPTRRGWTLDQKKRWLALRSWQGQKRMAGGGPSDFAMRQRYERHGQGPKRRFDCRGGICRLIKETEKSEKLGEKLNPNEPAG
jgi:hypothetical protein